MSKRVLLIIPARKGSKRIIDKNVINVLDNPLITYTIGPALQARCADRIIVTTDDPQVKKIAHSHGIEVFDRAPRLASDKAKMIDVVIDVLSKLKTKGYAPDIIILLQPTSPLRTAEDIDTAISIMLYAEADSVVSVCEVKPNPKWAFELDRTKGPKYLFKDELGKRSQELKPVYAPNGAIFAATREVIINNKSFEGKKLCPMIMTRTRSIDVDEYSDLVDVENYLAKSNNRHE